MAAMLVPVPYFPKRNCVMEPEARQFIASPIQGRIASCLVQPGDTVEAGQLLATIADDQLQRDLATARAQLESAEQKSNAALSSKTSGNYAQAMLEQEKAALEIESITRQLERLEVRSPVPGVVLYGDLRKSVGMPVTLGQNLFEVAELHSMTAEIQLTASDLEQIHVGDSVTVRSDATGFRGFHGTIHRIEPRATIIDNSAIFVADVIINDSADQLRPGMKATARIDAGWRSIGWLMFHRPLQWLAQQWVW
jgi:RND family efflux transporter MFP subunit